MPIETTASVVAGVPDGAELLAVPYTPELVPAVELDLPVPLPALLAHYEAKGEAGEIIEVPVAREGGVGRVLLYGVGDGSPKALRKAAAGLTRRAKGREELTVVVPEGDAAAFAEAALLAAYSFRIGAPGKTPVRALRFASADERAVRRGETVAQAVALARDLANTPASVKTPAWLAERAGEQGVPVRVWDEEQLQAAGFGGILAVGRGSASPPRLIQLSYTPEGPAERHVVLVGKGITFDSGGLSLKPTENMKTQKTDMAGGAVVIAVIGALARMGAPVRVTGLVAAAENMPSGTAQRPSDVITHYGGRTVEVLNTDAEGRLVLADALAYADAELDPDAVVDIATLTGAISVALGRNVGAVYSTDDDLAKALLAAGRDSDDRLWRMPLIEEYAPALDSPIADLANVESGSTYGAGSITAALFLREFAGGRPWAHLDIAGVGRSTVDDGILTKGATGFGVRVLLEWLTRG
ncbi:M17 family metallopeptidase [Nonomuraea roseoviolacea subsp. roseoviolacea]|uniref:Probable cytosol aminopeptidase n=1 Tax=Nonomuraea roseoviolacea subsp. carminata TaxID=160689 RepID=A0ABT1K3D2_9ACTN|nr:leucyl aminopeptidase [Nonomuraea roseoviolacea]MCP2348509.1 leucyl aminopeptidase [Nonomuraea roseoviolacea subsp. carminata]